MTLSYSYTRGQSDKPVPTGYRSGVREARIGCSGWNYRDWRDDFYPPRPPASRWLAHYASVLATVEGHANFHRRPDVTAMPTVSK